MCLFERNLFTRTLRASLGGHDDDCSFLIFRRAESFEPIGLPRFWHIAYSFIIVF